MRLPILRHFVRVLELLGKRMGTTTELWLELHEDQQRNNHTGDYRDCLMVFAVKLKLHKPLYLTSRN